MEAEERFLGLDIGGTKCAVVLGDVQGRVLGKQAFATGEAPGWKGMLELLLEAAERLQRDEGRRARCVGISCGGPLDSRRGVLFAPPNLPGWENAPLCAHVQGRLGLACYLQNDANACALAEWRYGAGKGCRHMAFLTFGTGLGAGLILNGALYEGASGMAGELGHLRLDGKGPVGYNKAGSFEGFCSGGGLAKLAKLRLGQELSAKELVERADAGDAAAAGVLRESASRLGQGLSLLVDLINPERIVIGSVYARAERWFRQEALRVMREECLAESLAAVELLPSALGEGIGDVAALAVAVDGWRRAYG